MTKVWSYLSNVFDNVTKHNFKRMLTIVADHLSKLAGKSSDPEIQEIYDRTRPARDTYASKYSGSILAKRRYSSETQHFEEKIAELIDVKLKEWDLAVQGVFLEGSIEYKAIFNHGRTAFRQGTYEQRIAELQAMAEVLRDYPELAETQVDVDTFCTDLEKIRDVQQQKEGKVTEASKDLEAARVSVANIMFANLSLLINKYRDNLSKVEEYFDLSLLRSSNGNGNGNSQPPEPMTGTVAPEAVVTVLAGGFDSNSYFNIVNTGGTSLKFYSAMLPDDPLPGSALELLPGEEADAYASELGASGNLFIMVNNPDKVNEGTYSFLVTELVEA